jgi:transcriptional regulator with XRE-family HTH domain
MNINEFKRKIGLNIKSIRVKRDLKQVELADFAQLTRGSICKVERGEQNFTIETLFAIASVLKVEPKSLLDFD